MAIEKKWPAVPPQLFTSNGGVYGEVQVASTKGFKVKQSAVISAVGQNNLAVQVKRVLSPTILLVGPIKAIQGKQGLQGREDLTNYTVAAGAFIYAEEQDKATLKPEDIFQAVYDQEPTVAIRSVMVDQFGDYYQTTNPLPVKLSDGSINIGTVNAELEVELTHKDNFPDLGDIADSVRVGDGVDELGVNADGSINVNLTQPVLDPYIENISAILANTEYSFAFPFNTKKFLIKVRDGYAKMRIAFAPGDTSTDYIGISMGSFFNEEVNVSNKTIYFQTNKTNQIIELLYWVQP